MSDQWSDRLSEYLDDELTAGERAELDAHLASCTDCADTLKELRGVVARAGSLSPVPPRTDLWPAIAARLEERSTVTPFGKRPPRRISFTLPQAIAAGLALMVLSGGAVWLSQFGGQNTSLPPVNASVPEVSPASIADPRYDEAVRELEETLATGRSQLDPDTVRILESNLQAIDNAIDQSRRALREDPGNLYLNNHLAAARQRKLALLRRASALVGAKS
jgi:hypothetical protein